MRKLIKNIRNVRGITFLEVMIALTLTGIITIGIYKLYISQHRNYMIQDDITEIQQNARASIDEVGRNLRMAGFALPTGLQAIEAYNTNPDTIVINYFDNGCQTYLSAAMPLPSSELKCGTDVSCYHDGQWVYIHDPNTQTGEWFEITHVQPDAIHLQHNTMTLSKAYDKDAVILAVTQIKYFVDNTTDPSNPKLMIQRKGKDPEIFADNIINLQFRYRMDNGLLLDEPALIKSVAEILISVTGQSYWVDVENNNKPIKTRTFSTSINPRNI